MDVKSAFLYGKIEEEVYVCQPLGFEDPNFPNRVYKVEKALYGWNQAPRAWYETLSTYLLENRFQRGKIDKTLFIKRDQGELIFFLGLQVKQKEDGIFISQDKYVTKILKVFSFSDVKTASTPMETHKPLLKDADGEDVDEHMYRSMIGSLMYLTSSRTYIMFVVSVCARFQVNLKVSNVYAVKRIFRYLKCQPKLGLWYPKDLPFDLVAYIDSDYAGASLDKKSTTGGCQFLGCRLISWQCKKQTVVANSITEAEYVAASSCYGQVLWIQNQLLDYGYNFMHTKIYIDNESIICIVKNLVFHSKTKHIEIRHHFIRDSNEKKLIQMIKIHTDKNVADLLTKAFDKGIGVNAGDSKLMLLGINLLLLEKVNAARHNLLLLVIVDFLNASSIKYALTVNPTIYTSCIEQFWSTAKAKIVNGEVQLQALVDVTPRKFLFLKSFAREKEEANAALITQWNDIHYKVETDYELAQRLQAKEQEELTIEEKSKLFQQLLEKRRKHFAAKSVEERRNRPLIKAQQRSIMVNTFVDMDTELVGGSEVREEGSETKEESSSKRAGDELEQEPSKKQKMEDDKETTELSKL
ncbi:putative ribonuclease H-like domain-containing protein [Tanacetum coccineum]